MNLGNYSNAYQNIVKKLEESPVDVPFRVEQKLAKSLLINNQRLDCDGYPFYINITNLGLGVCEVAKAPFGVCKTQMVKKFG